MKKGTRLLSILMLVFVIAAMMPVSVSAATKKPGKPKISSVKVSQQTVTVKYKKVKNAKKYKLYSVTKTATWKYVKKIKASQKKKYSNTKKYKLKKSGKKYKLYQKKSVASYKLLATTKKTSVSFKGNWGTSYTLALRAYNGKKAGSYSATKTATIGKKPEPVYVEPDYNSYETYVFFGSDSRANDESWKSPDGGKITTDQTGTEGVPRSDVIMLLQVNREKKTIDVVSIYRDTAMDRSTSGDPNFQKANKAYAEDGPLAALAVLEKNLDIKIKGYAASNFKGVADVIDDLGGVTVDIEDEALSESYSDKGSKVIDVVNNCIDEMNARYDRTTPHLEKSGSQTLSGLQAVAYARVRYTEGWEMRRTGRQREVLQQMIKKYNTLNAAEKIDLIISNEAGIETNLGLKDLANLIAAVSEYTVIPSAYPYYKGQVVKTTDEEDFNTSTLIVPTSIKDNVKQLHARVYGEDWYITGPVINGLSSRLEEEIANKTDIYRNYTGKVASWEKY